jgi:hypothetical protein
MAISKVKTVYACENCGCEYETAESADSCEKEDEKKQKFEIFLKEYKGAKATLLAMQKRLQAECPHANSLIIREESVLISDKYVVEYTKRCEVCEHIWIEEQ